MPQPPSGIVTFLFTDVEGSTRLWQECPEAMSVALARHDEILRSAIDAYCGYVFSTAGDAFAAAFSGSLEALSAATDAQRALGVEQWPTGVALRVRMGIHTGEAVERGGDYFGPALNLGARVMAAGHGGQVLMTSATMRLLAAVGIEARDLGEHALRDIDGRQQLFQVVAEGLVAEFPAIRTLTGTKSRLPAQRSSLIGRDDDVASVRQRLQGSRLVTLTGAGGCGKTRLAIEVAAREGDSCADGAFFVDLARVGDEDGVGDAFATAIDFVPDSGAPIADQVRARIGTKTMVLVVDNCEHVLDEAAEQIDGLLAACPNLRMVATTREALEVDGEQVVRVQSLAVDIEQGRAPAVRLFVERATEAGAELHGSDDAVIAAICARLDGLPLAIELAAARTAVLSPAQILERLDDRFTLLTGGRRRTRGRQQTLEATIDWSYDLLDVNEQEALRRVSVMPEAFDLDLAAAVLDRPAPQTLDLLDALTARSLLHTERDLRSGEVRYRLLETIRVYAYQRLVDAGDAETTRDRHANHLADRLDAFPDLPMSMVAEHYSLADDALMALEWARARDDLVLGARIVSGLTPIFIGRGLIAKGKEFHAWAEEVDDPILRSKVFVSRAGLEVAEGRQSHTYARRARLAAGDHPVPWLARTHAIESLTFLFIDSPRAEEHNRLARIALLHPDAIHSDESNIDLWDADLGMWKRDYLAAVEASRRGLLRTDLPVLIAMNLHGAYLLASVLARRRDDVREHLLDPRVDALRASWLDAAYRGEHWLLSYEAIRAAARSYIGEPDQARHDLANVVTHVGAELMIHVDEDFLGAYAWICLECGEIERARQLLDDTWATARSPNTYLLLTEAYERAHAITEMSGKARFDEMVRRAEKLAAVDAEHRARRMLESELTRLHLTAT